MLNIEQNTLNRPIKLPAQAVQIAAAPFRPGPGPSLPVLGRHVDRKTCRKERSVIVRELEAILAFDALELDVRQPRLKLIEAFLCQTTCGLRTQTYSLIADHRRTLTPTEARSHPSSARSVSTTELCRATNQKPSDIYA